MKAAIEKFLDYLRSVRNASPHTLRSYETDLEQFLAYLSPPEAPAAAGPADRSPHDPRISRPPARPETAEKFHRAQAGGAAVVFQVLRARRDGPGQSGAPGGHAQAAQAIAVGSERRGDERVSGSAGHGARATRGAGGKRAASKRRPTIRRGCCSSATARFSNCSTLRACASAS